MIKSLFTCSILLFGSQVSLALDALPDLNTRVYHQEEYSAGDNPYKVKRYAPEYYANHANHFVVCSGV